MSSDRSPCGVVDPTVNTLPRVKPNSLQPQDLKSLRISAAGWAGCVGWHSETKDLGVLGHAWAAHGAAAGGQALHFRALGTNSLFSSTQSTAEPSGWLPIPI